MPSTLPEDSYNISKALDNSDEFPSWVQAKQLPNKDGDNSHLQQSDSSLHAAFFWFLHLLKPVGSPLTVGFSLQEWWAPGCQGLSETDTVPRKRQGEGRMSLLPLAGTKAATGLYLTTLRDILHPNSPGCQVCTCWWTEMFSVKLNIWSFSRRPHL